MQTTPPALGRVPRLWRSLAAAAVTATLVLTTVAGTDDDFPLGPMTQFAFSVSDDGGQIQSHWLEAETRDGTRLRLPMDAMGAGLKRAEVEGQVKRFVADPSLLEGIARQQNARRPDRPLARIIVVREIKQLRRGRVVSTTTEPRVTWEVR
ncbi:hypothetical protein ACSNOI_46020 [Actinomadura kijaniata]|uniref:hypothetical protein n=1 Tax=Actinomadura kijaniata TaxID=46161 RepID=UPI003F1C431B